MGTDDVAQTPVALLCGFVSGKTSELWMASTSRRVARALPRRSSFALSFRRNEEIRERLGKLCRNGCLASANAAICVAPGPLLRTVHRAITGVS